MSRCSCKGCKRKRLGLGGYVPCSQGVTKGDIVKPVKTPPKKP